MQDHLKTIDQATNGLAPSYGEISHLVKSRLMKILFCFEMMLHVDNTARQFKKVEAIIPVWLADLATIHTELSAIQTTMNSLGLNSKSSSIADCKLRVGSHNTVKKSKVNSTFFFNFIFTHLFDVNQRINNFNCRNNNY